MVVVGFTREEIQAYISVGLAIVGMISAVCWLFSGSAQPKPAKYIDDESW